MAQGTLFLRKSVVKDSGAVVDHQKKCLLINLLAQTAQMAASVLQGPHPLCSALKEHTNHTDVRFELKTVYLVMLESSVIILV